MNDSLQIIVALVTVGVSGAALYVSLRNARAAERAAKTAEDATEAARRSAGAAEESARTSQRAAAAADRSAEADHRQAAAAERSLAMEMESREARARAETVAALVQRAERVLDRIIQLESEACGADPMRPGARSNLFERARALRNGEFADALADPAMPTAEWRRLTSMGQQGAPKSFAIQ